MAPPDLLDRVAADLGLAIEGRPAGGENGAAYVRDAGGALLVLKADAGTARAAAWARGAALAGTLRRLGYPAPRYHGTGTTGGASWSLQAVMPGAVPDRTTPAHVRRLVALAASHADRAPRANASWRDVLVRRATADAAALAAAPGAPPRWGREVRDRLPVLGRAALRAGDVVHGDFHHRNYLADGERVTGVFDWEAAEAGDWRFDLATLAFWSCLARHEMAPAARDLALAAAATDCPPSHLALFALCLTARTLAFYAARRPAAVGPAAEAIDARVAAWWR